MGQRLDVLSTQTTSENGTVKSERTITKTIVKKGSQEPSYIKCYLHDMSILHRVQRFSESVMWELLKLIEYDSNEIRLPSETKKDIARRMMIFRDVEGKGPTPNTNLIDQHICKLIKAGLLLKKGVGVFIANPHFFGKGQWEKINNIRMTITYDNTGKNIYSEINKSYEEDDNQEENY